MLTQSAHRALYDWPRKATIDANPHPENDDRLRPMFRSHGSERVGERLKSSMLGPAYGSISSKGRNQA